MAVTDKEKKYPDWWYQSANQEEINALAGQIASRPAFQFKVDHEALYNYYKGEYDRQGREAKMDTQAKIAGLTGGHDNSYARRAGQQAYEGQMALLQEDVAPDLWQMALDKYTREGEALVDQYTALQKQEEKDRKAWEKEYKDEIEAWEEEQAEAERKAASTPEAKLDRILGDGMRYDPMMQHMNQAADRYEGKFGVSLPNVFTPHSKEPHQIGDGVDDRLPLLESNGYDATNYAQAVSRLRNMGASQQIMQQMLTEKEFNDVQKANAKAQETNEGTYNVIVAQYGTYAEYLRGYLATAETAKKFTTPGYTGHYYTGTGGRYGTTGGAM